MNNIKRIAGNYLPTMPIILVYILQQTDYDVSRYLEKIRTSSNLNQIKKRGKLEKTNKVKLLLVLSYFIYTLVIFALLFAVVTKLYLLALIILLLLPFICIFGLIIPVIVANLLLNVVRKKDIKTATDYFANHKAIKIAVLGSYGKTSMKELLAKVLGSHYIVAATPGNQNIPISISRWASKLRGDEEILIFEYGESKPGDIATLARLTHPNYAFATGFAPNHLDGYKNTNILMADFQSITKFVSSANLFANKQMETVYASNGDIIYYSDTNIGGWEVKNTNVSINGLKFEIAAGKKSIKISSKLLGRHNIGPLAAVAVFAESLGVSIPQIETAIAKTQPYEHRMQPKQLHGAWLIDDTYNGNLEGFKAGLALLNELPAKRKIYVTPGLVEQGEETENVHIEIGRSIALCNPDIVVLMQNSVTNHMVKGLSEQNYKGSIKIETDPLAFYTNIDQFVANGDLVLMQNDWPDGYQ